MSKDYSFLERNVESFSEIPFILSERPLKICVEIRVREVEDEVRIIAPEIISLRLPRASEREEYAEY